MKGGIIMEDPKKVPAPTPPDADGGEDQEEEGTPFS